MNLSQSASNRILKLAIDELCCHAIRAHWPTYRPHNLVFERLSL
jgi:hypothetical protein